MERSAPGRCLSTPPGAPPPPPFPTGSTVFDSSSSQASASRGPSTPRWGLPGTQRAASGRGKWDLEDPPVQVRLLVGRGIVGEPEARVGHLPVRHLPCPRAPGARRSTNSPRRPRTAPSGAKSTVSGRWSAKASRRIRFSIPPAGILAAGSIDMATSRNSLSRKGTRASTPPRRGRLVRAQTVELVQPVELAHGLLVEGAGVGGAVEVQVAARRPRPPLRRTAPS